MISSDPATCQHCLTLSDFCFLHLSLLLLFFVEQWVFFVQCSFKLTTLGDWVCAQRMYWPMRLTCWKWSWSRRWPRSSSCTTRPRQSSHTTSNPPTRSVTLLVFCFFAWSKMQQWATTFFQISDFSPHQCLSHSSSFSFFSSSHSAECEKQQATTISQISHFSTHQQPPYIRNKKTKHYFFLPVIVNDIFQKRYYFQKQGNFRQALFNGETWMTWRWTERSSVFCEKNMPKIKWREAGSPSWLLLKEASTGWWFAKSSILYWDIHYRWGPLASELVKALTFCHLELCPGIHGHSSGHLPADVDRLAVPSSVPRQLQ